MDSNLYGLHYVISYLVKNYMYYTKYTILPNTLISDQLSYVSATNLLMIT